MFDICFGLLNKFQKNQISNFMISTINVKKKKPFIKYFAATVKFWVADNVYN